MLKTIQIVMIVVAIIAVAVAIYFLTRPKDDKSSSSSPTTQAPKSGIQKLLDDALGIFGIKTKDSFKQERFTDPPTFKTLDDIPKYMPTFFKYAFPRIDMEEVNALLKQYGVNKTAEQIFKDKEGLSFEVFTSDNKFGDITEMLDLYSYIIFEDNDINNVMNSFRLIMVIVIAILSFKAKKEFNLPIDKFPVNGEDYNITDYYFELPSDFEFNTKYIKMYMMTNLNKNLNDNNTKLVFESTEKEIKNIPECLTTKLCNIKISIEDAFKEQKELAIKHMKNIKRFFKLGLVSSLLQLNGTDVPQPLIDEAMPIGVELGRLGIIEPLEPVNTED